MKLWVKILIAIFLGLIVGLTIGPHALYLKPIGTIFLSLISMIIVPLVFSSMVVGITSINDPKKLGRVGLRSLVLYFSTTVIAISIGLVCASLIEPGAGLNFVQENTTAVVKAPQPLSDILITMVPTNPISSLASGNMLQIIVFSLFLGVAINFAGPKGKPLLSFFESLSEVMFRLTSIVMEFAPIGIFAIIAWVAGSFGFAVLLPLLKFLGAFYLAAAIHVMFILCGILRGLAKVKVVPFFKGMGEALIMAFSTCSSTASIPVSLHCLQENLGVSKNISSFVMPLGCTFNMNGTAIFQAMSALFVAQAYGIPLDFHHFVTITFAATLSAIATAGVPGSGFIMVSAVLTAAGLPIEGLAILAGIDKLREMVATTLNIMGDAVCAVYVAKMEGELDEKLYYHTELVKFNPDVVA